MTSRAEDGYNKTLPTRIRAIMNDKRIKQKDLSEKTGIPRQSLGTYADGRNVPDAEKLAKIADALGVTSDYLIGLSDKKNDSSGGIELDTAGDVICILLKLQKLLKCEFDIIPRHNADGEFVGEALDCVFHSKPIVEYFKEYLRMKEFFTTAPDKAAAEKYQSMVSESMLMKADCYIINPEYKSKTVDDEELPF